MTEEQKKWWDEEKTVVLSPREAFSRLFEEMKSTDLRAYWDSSPVARDLILEKMVRVIFQ